MPQTQGYSLKDNILLDSLFCVGSVVKDYTLVGGVAAAMHVYPRYDASESRKTIDLDISLRDKISEAEFKNVLGANVDSHLQMLQYRPFLKKIPSHYEIVVKDGGNPFFIHFSNRPYELQKVFARRIETEIKNAVEMKIPERDGKIRVARAEDIILPKLQLRRPKDVFDIALLKKHGPSLEMNYLKENARFWFGGEEKIIASALDYLMKL